MYFNSENIENNLEYTCLLHSQIRLIEPGNCPICGMTLEPVSAKIIHRKIILNKYFF
jgi:hypothetical protein